MMDTDVYYNKNAIIVPVNDVQRALSVTTDH